MAKESKLKIIQKIIVTIVGKYKHVTGVWRWVGCGGVGGGMGE